MNYKEQVKKKLRRLSEEDIIITPHARIRAIQRQIKIEDIKENIINPHRLYYAIKEAVQKSEEKFDCYFAYSNTQCHRYILVISKKVVVVTAVKINRRWQKIIESKLRGK